MLTHFWDADGVDLHIISLRTNGKFKPGEAVELCNEPYVIQRIVSKFIGLNESLHIYARMVTS